MYGAIFIAEILLIFILSSIVARKISSVLLRLTRSRKVTIYLMSLIFLPGIIIHELSHYFCASLLFVRVGKINFLPKISDSEKVTMGSVEIEKTDPIRRFLIGASPFFFGMVIICVVPFYIFRNGNSVFPPDNAMEILIILFITYFLFTVANSMFSSKKDMEGSLVLLIFLAVIAIGLRFSGIEFETVLISLVVGNENVFKNLSILLLPSVLIDLLILASSAKIKG